MILLRPIVAIVFWLGLVGLGGLSLPGVAQAAPLSVQVEQAPLSLSPLAVAGGSLLHFSGDRPENLGPVNQHLQPCPDSPNCVSSQSKDVEHAIEPLSFDSSPRMAMQALKHVIDDSERAEVIKADGHYVYAEFTSKLLGFVDDVEFYLNEADRQIEVRSASRLGESDLGVNRKRVEQLRQQFDALLLADAQGAA